MDTSTKSVSSVESIGRLWVGCLSCYNGGRLRGEWLNLASLAADFAETLTAKGLSTTATYASGSPYQACTKCGGDEWEVFDSEIPFDMDISLCDAEAAAAAIAGLADMDDDTRRACIAYADNLDYNLSSPAEWMSEFEILYMGTFDNLRDFTDWLACDMFEVQNACDSLRRYFDFDAWARDVQHDYMFLDVDGNRVAVFSD